MPAARAISLTEGIFMKNQSKSKKKHLPSPCAHAHNVVIPRLTLECIERYELLLCGCRRVELYSQQKTVVCAHKGKVSISGEGLTISFLGDGKIKLSGAIDAIEFI
jgi:hypothetical protein